MYEFVRACVGTYARGKIERDKNVLIDRDAHVYHARGGVANSQIGAMRVGLWIRLGLLLFFIINLLIFRCLDTYFF